MKRNRGMRLCALTVVLIGICLGGCGSMEPLPSDTFYRLHIDHAASITKVRKAWSDGVVRVAKFKANGVHRERPIAYSDAGHVVVKQHRYHLWVDSPERMLQAELVSFLRAAEVARNVTAIDISGEKLEVIGTIHRMDHVVENASESVVIVLSFELISHATGKTILHSNEYRETRTVANSEMHGAAAAMSDAVTAIYTQFVADADAALSI